MNVGAVISCSSGNQPEDLIEIAFSPNVELRVDRGWGIAGDTVGDVMEDGWTWYYFSIPPPHTRCSANPVQSLSFTSGDVLDAMIHLWVCTTDPESWLSQANHIFSRLGIMSNFGDYGKTLTHVGLHFR